MLVSASGRETEQMTRNELVEALNSLSEHQLDIISKTVIQYVELNNELGKIQPECCPICGSTCGKFIKKGFLRGKQRFACKECGHKFTYDSRQLTAHSHQPVESWTALIRDTLKLVPLQETAEQLRVSKTTAFYMRHRFLVFLMENPEFKESLSGIIEADETYMLESQKGKKVTDRKPRSHGRKASKRGLSNEQLCICVATDRDNRIVASCVNRARPSSEEIQLALSNYISSGSVILCDGAQAYNDLAAHVGCVKIELKGHCDYNKVYHLNTVNSSHARFKNMLRQFRGISSKYLNRYLALFRVLFSSTMLNLYDKVDYIRRSLSFTRIKVNISSLASEGLLTI